MFFALLGGVFALWAVATFFAAYATTQGSAIFWVRTVMFLAVPQSVLFMLLMHTFPRATLALPFRPLVLLVGMSLGVMAIAYSPYLFPEVKLIPGGTPQPSPGPGLIAFVPLAVGSVLLGIFYVIRKNIASRGIEKTQMRYLLAGTLTMFSLIVLLNFVAVVAFKKSSFANYGPLFTLPFVIATAYSIIRYRLMDIRFFVVRSVLFSLLVGTFFLLYGLIIWVATTLAAIRGVILTPGIHALAAVIVTAVAIFAFRWYQAFLEQVTNRVFFKARYNARQALINLGRELTETIDIGRIQELLTKTLRETVKVEKVIVFLRDTEQKVFRPSWGTEFLSPRTFLQDTHPLVRHLKHSENLIVRDELPLILERQDPRHDAEEIKEIQTALSWVDAALVLPLMVKGELTGMLFLGDKLAGDPFSTEDLELLTILAPQAATALENARLYQQAAEFGRTLEREVARATEELQIANEQLKDTDKAKSEFLSIASHQLYTPLTAIRGYLSMIAEGDFGNVPEKLRNSLNIVTESSERLIELIKNLLDVSRIESGRLELSLESVDLTQMAKELVAELTPNAEKKKLNLTFQEPPRKLASVVADAQRLRQVLLNTLDNAIKYTNQGSVEVRVQEHGDDVVYSVKDTGRGMSKDALARLFAKFTRMGARDGQRADGLGLGLYVARQMIREIHGDIWAESEGEGKGSTFTVRLPAEGSPQALKAGTKLIVGIKAAETGQRPADLSGEAPSGAKSEASAKSGQKPTETPAKPEEKGGKISGETEEKPAESPRAKKKKPPIP